MLAEAWLTWCPLLQLLFYFILLWLYVHGEFVGKDKEEKERVEFEKKKICVRVRSIRKWIKKKEKEEDCSAILQN